MDACDPAHLTGECMGTTLLQEIHLPSELALSHAYNTCKFIVFQLCEAFNGPAALTSPVLASSENTFMVSAPTPLNNVLRPCINTAVLTGLVDGWLCSTLLSNLTQTNTQTDNGGKMLPPVRTLTILCCTASRREIKR